MNCTHCGLPLNQSQYRRNKTKKSCPNCSVINGKEHVYYDYDAAFGTTPLRSSNTSPEGAQSYCIACRGNQPVTLTATLCSSL